MATKPTVTVIFLSFLFTISYARFPSDLTENYVTTNDLNPLPESEPKTTNTIILPSEKSEPESEPANFFEWEPKTTESKLPEISEESTESETVPLTVISFRPVNRHFPRRPMVPFRHRHGCRHSHQFKPWGPRVHNNREIPYGNDMILSGEDLGSESSDPVIRGGQRQIPTRWVRFHHGGARFPFKHDDVEGREDMKRRHHHHHEDGEEHEHEHEYEHHDHDHEHEHEHEHEHGHGHEHEHEHEHDGGFMRSFHEHEHEHDGGFMRRFRKFLNQF